MFLKTIVLERSSGEFKIHLLSKDMSQKEIENVILFRKILFPSHLSIKYFELNYLASCRSSSPSFQLHFGIFCFYIT